MQAGELGPRVTRAHRGGDAIALGGEKTRQQVADAAIVVDQQDMRRVVGRLCRTALRGGGKRHAHSFAGAARKIVSSTLSGSSRSIIARRKRRTVSAFAGPISSSARLIGLVCRLASLPTSASPFGVA